jgi:hypothetical protein
MDVGMWRTGQEKRECVGHGYQCERDGRVKAKSDIPPFGNYLHTTIDREYKDQGADFREW